MHMVNSPSPFGELRNPKLWWSSAKLSESVQNRAHFKNMRQGGEKKNARQLYVTYV